jgi:hypothetical protein
LISQSRGLGDVYKRQLSTDAVLMNLLLLTVILRWTPQEPVDNLYILTQTIF